MNYKHISMLIVLSGLLLVSCKNTIKSSDEDFTVQNKIEQQSTITTNYLVGSWQDQSEKALHFTLYADGTAQSDNMATLLYQKWDIKDNQLSLVAKSIGNGSSSIDTITYEIQKLNEDQMILKQGDLSLEYKKVSQQKTKTLKGKLTIGHEVRSFKPCGSDQTFWILDQTGQLKELYNELTVDEKPYTPIFAEIEFIDKGRSKDGFSADYESVYEIVNILKTRKTSDKDCD